MLCLYDESARKMTRLKTFGQVIREARKSVGLTQYAVAKRLQSGDGRKVLPPFLNDLQFNPASRQNVIEQLAKILKLSPDVLYSTRSGFPETLRTMSTRNG